MLPTLAELVSFAEIPICSHQGKPQQIDSRCSCPACLLEHLRLGVGLVEPQR
jgi:hypothetical protein